MRTEGAIGMQQKRLDSPRLQRITEGSGGQTEMANMGCVVNDLAMSRDRYRFLYCLILRTDRTRLTSVWLPTHINCRWYCSAWREVYNCSEKNNNIRLIREPGSDSYLHLGPSCSDCLYSVGTNWWHHVLKLVCFNDCHLLGLGHIQAILFWLVLQFCFTCFSETLQCRFLTRRGKKKQQKNKLWDLLKDFPSSLRLLGQYNFAVSHLKTSWSLSIVLEFCELRYHCTQLHHHHHLSNW